MPDPKASGDGGSVPDRASFNPPVSDWARCAAHQDAITPWQRHRVLWSLTTDLRSSLKPLGIRNGIKLTLSPSQA